MTTTTTVRKTAPKKTAAPKRAPRAAVAATVPQDEPDYGIELDSSRPVAAPDVFPIFRIDGVQYYAPARPKANVELTYLYKTRHEGELLAGAYLIEELVGHDGYVALMNYGPLTTDDLERIIKVLFEAVQGASAAGPKGGLRIG
jgi:hypothetical protein